MSVYGLYIIGKITDSNPKITNLKNFILITILSFLAAKLNNPEYNSLYTISIFALNIIVYKVIFNIKIEESLIACGILMLFTFIGDLITSISLSAFFSINEIRNTPLLYLLTTIIVSLIGIVIVKNRKFLNQFKRLYSNISKNNSISTILFLVLLIVGLSSIAYNRKDLHSFNEKYIINIIIMVIYFVLTYLFIRSQNSYDELSANYDNLFYYVQNFEDWIEKEQLNRHEYKNQLAVLRCLTKEKKVKSKIDEILEDNINIEGKVIQQLKSLPKGGIKGLMYYKVALAQKKNINVEVNVSLEAKSELSKLKEKDIRILCKLIGIYLDNAIEAAVEPRKKNILIEVYEIKQKVIFVFSNTFKKHKNFKDRNKKGISSKGEGRGNGLYFASNLIFKNNWISQKQEIIDGYYIQQLIISKKNKSHQ